MTRIWFTVITLTYYVVDGHPPCLTPDGKGGECKSIIECPKLRTIVNKPKMTPYEAEFLKRSGCGFEDSLPKVCCATTNTCLTPEGSEGQCINVLECKHIAKRLQSPTVSDKDKAYVNSIRCHSPTGFYVCCGQEPEPGVCVPSAAPPSPGSGCCGVDGSGGNRITGGNATSLDQYPWLAIIENKRSDITRVVCGGALISGRYVLTAGHCVKGLASNAGTPANVRLGEYDISHEGADCVPVEGGDSKDEDCTEEPVVIPIERVIPHPDFDPTKRLRRHDIALLRLSRLAPYTDFIRPICLPTSDLTTYFPPSGRLFAAGWGPNNETHETSAVKLHVDLPYKTIESCQPAYDVPKRHVALWDHQICAGGEKGKDTCKGDSGGPLMYSMAEAFEVVGVVSFGPTPCGLANVPGVYTKVFNYLPWIRSVIQP
ncbi:phenoloxidase-activating enzyme-like [Leguminivora glycinivorella]|uniref:phenoloxidase-activating enzyme-like n=1 Tax=Leguminivora glycinivorella TaxID=1035111 RepID=UPI00200FDFD2|nr:phenoloxidase-activating enzyme-like [Leguminivora glycinivorella]